MRKILLILPLIYVCIYYPCFGDDIIDKEITINDFLPALEKNSTLYVWLNNLVVRENPGLSSKSIDYLQFADEVVYLNEMSNVKSRITVRGKIYNAPWIKIKTGDGKIGWIYSVGVKTDFVKMYREHGYPEDQINIAHLYENLSPFIPNDEGNKLVATESVVDPHLITKAIYNKWYHNIVADIRHIGNKKRTGNALFSFESSEGPLYEVIGNQKVTFKGLVVDERFLKDREIIPLIYSEIEKNSEAYNDVKSRIEQHRKWKIDNLWIKYAKDISNLLAIVLHEEYKGYVMLSIVLATHDKVIFHDHIAEYKEGEDLFRVDDMGEFDPMNIRLDFLFKTNNEYELVYNWDGAEGRNLYIVRQYKDRFILGKRIYQPISY